jgi:hypothetical protein
MSDDVDPAVSDALRRLAAAAPQPEGDRLQAVINGAHRRQRRVVGASALSVVALVTATGLGVHSWRDSASHTPTPATTFGNPSTSSSGAPVSSPASSLNGFAPESSAPASSPASVSPSARVHATVKPAAPTMAPTGQVKPKISLQLSPTHAVVGQQIQATLTIANTSRYIYPAAVVTFNTEYPSPFDHASKGCSLLDDGATCSVGELRPGQRVTLVFAVTPQFPGDQGGEDEFYGEYNYTDSHGQPQQAPQFSSNLIVTSGPASSAPPSSGVPASPPASPPSSTAPSTAKPSTTPSAVSSATATSTPSASGTPSVTPSAH